MQLPDETRRLLRWVQGGLGDASGEGPEVSPAEAGEGGSADDEGRGEQAETGPAAAASIGETLDADTADAADAEAANDGAAAADTDQSPSTEGSPAEEADTINDAGDGADGIDTDGLDDAALDDSDTSDDANDDGDLNLEDAIDELDDRYEDDPVDDGPAESVPFEDTVADRDKRIDQYSGSHPHDEIRQRLRETGIAERIQHELADLFRGQQTQSRPRQNMGQPDTDLVGGRPAMRQVVRRFAGDLRVRDVFERPSPGQDDDVAVGVVLDLSSSMQGDAEGDAKAAAGAFLFAIEQFGGDAVAVSYPRVGETSLMTGVNERFRWQHLDSGKAAGGTPTSQAVPDGADLLEQCSADQYLLIVLTDGRPKDTPAAKLAVDAVRDRGRDWAVVGFGYGNVSEDRLAAVFGDDGYRAVEIEDLPTELVDVYREQHPRF